MRHCMVALFVLVVLSVAAIPDSVSAQDGLECGGITLEEGASGVGSITEAVEVKPEASTGQKSPLLAGIISALYPGTGQFYNGEKLKGLVHFGVYCTALAVGLTNAGGGQSDEPGSGSNEALGVASLVVLLATMVWSSWDAQASAKRINAKKSAQNASLPTAGFGPLGFSLNADRGDIEARVSAVFEF